MEVFDQILTLLIELFYQELGSEKAFRIWWSFHLFFLFHVYITANVYILFDSREIFLDLTGESINISFFKIYRIVIPLPQTNALINTKIEHIERIHPEPEQDNQDQEELFQKRRSVLVVRETTTISKTLDIEMQDLDWNCVYCEKPKSINIFFLI